MYISLHGFDILNITPVSSTLTPGDLYNGFGKSL